MKKIISLFVVMFFSLGCIHPVAALTEELSYVNLDQEQSIDIGQLSFVDISFRNYSSTSSRAFGLTGTIVNRSDENVWYVSKVSYYDDNYTLLAQETYYENASPGVSSFHQMSNLSALDEHAVDEIYFYSLSIEIDDESNSSNLTPSQSDRYNHYDYVVDQYDIHIIVNENNTLDITEMITAYFNESKHGIIRSIPLSNMIMRLDGTSSTNRTQVTNVSVDHEYTTKRENGDYKIQIGAEDHTLTGEETYIIKYTYNLGKDPVEDYDELYFNIIGDEWDTVIGNVTFTIVMPKAFDSSKLGFSSGVTGSTDNSNVNYTVNGNTIVGSYQGILRSGEALTVRCELPEGYFVGAGLEFSFLYYVIYLLPVLFLGISIWLWYRFGKDDPIVETVEFYPPAGFNSLDVGFLYKGYADSKDVISLLIYLANKGYIKITETEEKSLLSKHKGFKITRLKEYDGNNANEQLFLEGLFTRNLSTFKRKKQSVGEMHDEVTSEDLSNHFYVTVNKILSHVNTKENKTKIFEKSATNKFKFIIMMIVVTYCLITIPLMLDYGQTQNLFAALLFPGLGFTMLFMLVIGNSSIHLSGYSPIVLKIFGVFWGLLFGGMPWFVFIWPLLKRELFYLVGYLLGLICVMGMVVCLKYLPKRTPYGIEILGKLQGFKNFLETAEKEKLEAMVTQDPSYFYDILPYTYVLGVSDTWIKKFESISISAPSWYEGTSVFDVISFGTAFNSTMVSAQRVMSSSPSSSSSSSSGGGFSGGGSGGGGGSSW